ncbi:MAG: LPS export ABC transporter periplasmic protein LptC [Rhodocyclaceae bacterium]
MRPAAEQLYPIIVLAVLAGATLWLERSTREDAPEERARVLGEPDFIAEQARITSFDASGALQYALVAERITHIPDGELTLLDAPVLDMEQEDRGLRVTARTGEVRRRGEQVFLRGDVHVWREGLDGEADLTLDAHSLTLWPDDQRARSDEPVHIVQGASTARGDGLRADNVFGVFELVGNAVVNMEGRTGARTQ